VALARVPARHLFVLEAMMLKTLALATGTLVDRIRAGARAAGLVEQWARQLSDRKWWIRAEAARALGLVRESRALPLIFSVLDDDHEEVRAAAVEALGLIGHPSAIPVLLARLADESRHQRARIVEALREFGDIATPALVEHVRTHSADAVMVADILGLIGGHVAAETLKQWARDPNQYVRTAAMRAMGTIGLDEEGAGLAVAALSDEAAEVRAMGARALGRSRRSDAAPSLAARLDDEWMVAASCADALRRLGRPGIDALQTRADDPGYVGELARQMLWERRTATAGAAA
jgi:HEAT repeat protein